MYQYSFCLVLSTHSSASMYVYTVLNVILSAQCHSEFLFFTTESSPLKQMLVIIHTKTVALTDEQVVLSYDFNSSDNQNVFN